MPTNPGKAAELCMIERAGLPAERRMALAAIVAERTGVRIIVNVTTAALTLRSCKVGGRMATAALRDRVAAQKFKACCRVTEASRTPVACGMAACAISPQSTSVWIIFDMT